MFLLATMSSSSSSLRQALLTAVEDETSYQSLVDLVFHHVPAVVGHSAKDQRSELLQEWSDSCSPAMVRRVLFGLQNQLQHAVSVLPSDVSPAQVRLALDAMHAAVLLVSSLVPSKNDSSKHCPKNIHNELMQCIQLLHDALFVLEELKQDHDSTAHIVQTKILSLCQEWYCQTLTESVLPQTLVLLLAHSLESTACKADLDRLYSLRTAFGALDWTSSQDLQLLMLKTVSSPLYAKTKMGIKLWILWLGFMPTEMHQAMRVQIPTATKSLLQAYAQVYYQAWNEARKQQQDDGTATTTTLSILEETLLPDWVHASLFVSSNSTHKAVLQVLEPFFENLKSPSVQRLLQQLYGPLLWRNLRAAHWNVRVRAAQALQHVFPLGDAKALPKATLALIQLLQDQHARVRIAGATTTVAALVLYWEAMPSSDIRQLLLLLQEHGRDTTSSAVRVSALHSIATLLDSQPASHAVLRTLLPTFGNLLHDTCERVRCATVHLLKTIKSIPGIKYYHVVPVSHLLARLVEDDDTKVATAITELVQNSYLPSSKTGQEQVQRLLHLVTNSFPAAKVFCAHLKLPTNVKAKLCVMLYKVLEHEGETKTKKHYGSKPQEPSLVVQVAEIIGILYQSMDLEHNEPSRDFVYQNLASLPQLYHSASDEDVKTALVQLARHLPPQPTMLESIVASQVPLDAPHMALLVQWGMAQEVATCLAASLAENDFGFDEDETRRTRGKRKSSRSRGGTLVPLSRARALEVIEALLLWRETSTVLLHQPNLSAALEKALQRAQRFLQGDETEDVPLLLQLCEVYARSLLHKGEAPNALLEWTQQHLLTPFDDPDLSRISALPSSPLPSKRTDRRLTPGKMVVERDTRDIVAKALLHLFKCIFSEWMAVGGPGAAELETAQWIVAAQ